MRPHLVTHIAWLGKKSPFCGNVTYGLAITEALRQRGHQISFIHFDTPAPALGRSAGSGEGSGDSPEVALPYLVTILALALAGRNAAYPGAYLKPYRRE